MMHLHSLKLYKKTWLFSVAMLMVLSTAAFSADRRSVAGNSVNVRTGPGTQHAIFYTVDRTYPLDVLATQGDWFQVQDVDGDVGWVHKTLLSKKASVITIKNNCNIRSGPGKEHAVLFIAEDGIPFELIERQKDWLHIRHAKGHEGWIYAPLVW